MLNNPLDSVSDYLAELLYEGEPEAVTNPAPQVRARVEAPVQEPALPVAQPQIDRERLTKLLRSAPLAQPAVSPVVVPAPVAEPGVPPVPEAPEAGAQVEADDTQVELLDWCENGRPNWAQDRFDVLLFTVYGLTLAVPLVALGQIQPLTDELTPLFGQADWFMGIQPTPMGKIRTVNTALFVMPERYDPAFLDTARYVISIDGLNWGLAVDSVQQPISLDPDEVKWRSGRGQRPWLAGTVKAQMCALLDIPNMGRILRQADRNG